MLSLSKHAVALRQAQGNKQCHSKRNEMESKNS